MSRIKIDTITPANSDGNELKGYYFLPDGDGRYSFYDRNNYIIASHLEGGFSFRFPVDGLRFRISIMSISDRAASGDWSDLGVTEVPGSGTFQAQASGTPEAEPPADSAAKGKAAV
jgi:hypothetical protein